jgi:hypothetical protein
MERVTRLELAMSTLGKKRRLSYSRAPIDPSGSPYSAFFEPAFCGVLLSLNNKLAQAQDSPPKR